MGGGDTHTRIDAVIVATALKLIIIMNNCGRQSLIRKPIRGVLINVMCNFEDGTRAATAASKSNAELDEMYERLRHVVA